MKEKFANVGKKGVVRLGGLRVEVEIIDYKHVYGHDRWLVTPLSGAGEVWIEDVEFAS